MNNEKEKQRIDKALEEVIRLRCKAQKKTPIEVIREMQFMLDQEKEVKAKKTK